MHSCVICNSFYVSCLQCLHLLKCFKMYILRYKINYNRKNHNNLQTGRSRGFCFVYFESQDDAKVAKNECTGMEIDGRRIRVDYSITQRAHTPTPGIYMGKPTQYVLCTDKLLCKHYSNELCTYHRDYIEPKHILVALNVVSKL